MLSVMSQLAAERLSTIEFSARAVNSFSHFSVEIYLMLFRLISCNSPSLAAACLITSSIFVLLGASAGKTFSAVA